MDKDTLRIIIFLLGLLIVAGIIAWSFLRHQQIEQEFEDYTDSLTDEDKLLLDNSGNDFLPANLGGKKKNKISKLDPISAKAEANAPPPPPSNVIEFSIVSQTGEGFNGDAIFKVLKEVGLEYGSLQIFERLDANKLVDFGVANMVKPGIFPAKNLTGFYCPGISFFMQPSKVEQPVEVFDDFIKTLNIVALKLGGEMWDNNRAPLSNKTIEDIRQQLV